LFKAENRRVVVTLKVAIRVICVGSLILDSRCGKKLPARGFNPLLRGPDLCPASINKRVFLKRTLQQSFQ
jgi:hypothetical protein